MIEALPVLRAVGASLLMLTLGIGQLPSEELPRPARATLGENESTAWSGGPFPSPDPTVCSDRPDSSCDRFRLEVRAEEGARVCVAITTAAPQLDDLDLYVFTPDGELLVASTGRSGRESVAFEHHPHLSAGLYEIRVQPWMVEPGTTYSGLATVTPPTADSPAATSICADREGALAAGGDLS